ncbi:MAG: VTT domain-containing protein [Mobilitalea sp.]
MKKIRIRTLDFATIFGLALSIVFIVYGIRTKIFVSAEALHAFLNQFGVFADVIFIVVQAVQVVIPILPGAIGCLAGVIIFGPIKGFLYNYIGICIGSLIAFSLSRRYGMGLVEKISKPKLLQKYSAWLYSDKFDKWFALAIFFPVAPDDFLCYLAGVTKISREKFAAIIFTAKPFSIAIYSMGLNLVFSSVIHKLVQIGASS